MITSPLLPQLKGYIGGRWTAGPDDHQVVVHNPATGEELARIPAMGAPETREAVAAASQALDQSIDLETRRDWLNRIVAALLRDKKEIGRILTLEHGKPWPEAEVEVEYAAGFFRYCADNLDVLKPRVIDERPRNMTWTVYCRPAGVAALITPWNFPIAMIAKKLAPALAAGCPTVIKPSSKTPLTMIALFALLERELDLPAGMVNLVIGPADAIGNALCEHPDVQVVSFTGSTEVGRQLMARCASQVKKMALELGGNAPFLVFADADLDLAADQLMANKFRGAGQTCVCANRILVQREVLQPFGEKVTERVCRLKVGNGMEPDIDIGPLIDRNGFNKVRRHVEDALAKGAQLLAGELPAPASRDWGCFYPPSVLTGVQTDMVVQHEETFGPLVPLLHFADENEAVRLANATEFGLASYLFTADDDRAQRVIRQLRFGHVGYNTGSGPTPEAPFGGMKQSGIGREGGIEGLFEFVEPQTVPRGF
ncbi:MAG TPA: aldehyde dehydrogenase family protein [Gammaproteobacteria bacterium]|nr:aldehyde dehydrogenase family protein [Gammaproteobacteria bacterium]